MIRKWLKSFRQYFEPKAVVLMYHRIDNLTYDPWQLAVSPEHFEQQLQVIRKKFNPISLAKLHQYVTARSIPARSVVLTFDDGYIDNFNYAKPLLEKYDIPATFFIATQNCELQRLYWWDELQQIILETDNLPLQLEITIGQESLTFDLADERVLTPELRRSLQRWIAFEEEPTRRGIVYLELWSRIRPLPDAAQQAILATLRKWANTKPLLDSQLVCMPPDHLKQLLSNPLFSLGAHTVTHPALADHSVTMQQEEIIASKLYLENLTNNPIQLFAYPYGHFADETVVVVKNQKFDAAVTTSEGSVTKYSQSLRLNRYQVNNWTGNEFNSQITKWFGN